MNFTNLNIWKKSHNLAIKVYKITKDFPKSELFGITSQLNRCATSIPANIAEDFGRKGNKEFIQFLYQAKGSLYETQNFLIFAKDIGYLPLKEYGAILNEYEILAKMINSFLSKIK